MALGHFVKHARADPKVAALLAVQEEIYGGGQPKAGTGAFSTLIEDCRGLRWIKFDIQWDQRGFVHAVPDVWRVRPYVKNAFPRPYRLCLARQTTSPNCCVVAIVFVASNFSCEDATPCPKGHELSLKLIGV